MCVLLEIGSYAAGSQWNNRIRDVYVNLLVSAKLICG